MHVTTIRSAARMLAAKARAFMHRMQDFFSHQESGASAIEYGLIAAGIALVIIPTIAAIGVNLNSTFTAIAAALAPA